MDDVVTIIGKAKTPKDSKPPGIQITAPNIQAIKLRIVGTSPYMQARLSAKAQGILTTKFKTEEQAVKKRAPRKARNFQEDFEGAKHLSTDGWIGIPSSGLRNAMISACRLVGFEMTRAKLAIFVAAEGADRLDGLPLFRIYGEPEISEMAVRNATGVIDIRVRPLWQPGWYAEPTISFDADIFRETDIVNLLARAGRQVGLGEGRSDSRKSTGLGFGFFEIAP